MPKSEVKYQIIYTIDIPKSDFSETKISDCKSAMLCKTSLFQVTETETDEPETYKAHRKYSGLLTGMQTGKIPK